MPNQIEEIALASAIAKANSELTNYRISAADLLEIVVYREDDLKREIRVNQSGAISFPLVGTLKIAGLTRIEAERLLADRLAEFIINPQISIITKEYAQKSIYVLGEVVKPGAYDVPPESELTVLEAISMAGGFTPVASKDKTRIIRKINGEAQTPIIVEVTKITNDGQKQKDVKLKPSDVVYVPQSIF